MDARKIIGVFLILLTLTYEFNQVIFTLAITSSQPNSFEMVENGREVEFLRKQLEEGSPPEESLQERSYVIPAGINTDLANRLWLSIAPLISLGYDKCEVIEAISELNLPSKLEVNGKTVLIDYVNLCIYRNPENGEVSVEIPIISNSSLSSVCYDVKGVKKHIKLYNMTSIRYYNVSVKASELYNVTYNKGGDRVSKAKISLSGDIKNNLIHVYLQVKSPALLQELCINLPADGFTLGLRILEYKVRRTKINSEDVDCYWIHIESDVKAARDLWRVMLSIGHGGGWIIKPLLVLRKGEYVSDYWIKWIEGDQLKVKICLEGFNNTFTLGFNEIKNGDQAAISRILSEDELKGLLEQPFYEKLNLSRVSKAWRIESAGEKVVNETVWVTGEEYEHLMRLGCRKGDSIFIDSGEAEWEYIITNRTLGSCKFIKLSYSPLKVNKGELVHGVTLRNYANSNLNYTLGLRTATNVFLFFSKIDEGSGSITVSKESIIPILLIQQEPAIGDATLELVKGDRVVATVKVYLTLKATAYWKGFWDGLRTKLPGIAITAGTMIVVSFLIPHAYVRSVYYLLLGVGVFSNLIEIALDVAEANKAREEMLSLAEALENRSSEFLAKGSIEHAEECKSLALSPRQEASSSIILNVFSGLTIGVGWDEIRIALGLKEPPARNEFERQYRIGYARGRVTGAVISCALYIVLYTMVNKIRAERVGQHLTVTQILKTTVRGVYNWITPQIWDATILAVQRKGTGFFDKVADLLLGNKYSRKFGETVGDLMDKIKAVYDDPSKTDDIIEVASEFSKQVIESIPSKESSSKILDAIGTVIEHCSSGELKEKGRVIVIGVVSMWIKDGDNAVDVLNSWLSVNAEDPSKMSVLEEILVAVRGDAPRGVGVKIGDIADSYLNIKGKYGESAAETFLNAVLKNPSALEEILAKLNTFDFEDGPHRVTLKKGRPSFLNLGKGNEVKPGTYVVRVYWDYGSGNDEKSGVMEFSIKKNIESDQINIPKSEVDQVLCQIGGDEAAMLVTKAEFSDCRLFFPAEFSVGGVKIGLDLFTNEMEIGGKHYWFKQDMDVWGGRLRIDAEFKGKNKLDNTLALSFYEDGEVAIKIGEYPYSIKKIEVDSELDLVRVEYFDESETRVTQYSFNLKPLDEQMGRRSYKILVEDRGRIGLKEELFELLGYDALRELEERMGRNIDEDKRVVLFIYFDNDKIAYCGSKELKVNVPPGAKSITSIEIITYKEFDEAGHWMIRILENPEDRNAKGELSEMYVELYSKDAIREKA